MINLYTDEDAQRGLNVYTNSAVTHPKVLLPLHLLTHHVHLTSTAAASITLGTSYFLHSTIDLIDVISLNGSGTTTS